MKNADEQSAGAQPAVNAEIDRIKMWSEEMRELVASRLGYELSKAFQMAASGDMNAAMRLADHLRFTGLEVYLETCGKDGWWCMALDPNSPLTRNWPADDKSPAVAVAVVLALHNGIEIPMKGGAK